MTKNPFKPPLSEIADVLPSNTGHAPAKAFVIALLALFAIHVALFAIYFSMIAELVRIGAMPAIGPLLGLLADIALLIAIVLLLLKCYAKIMFFMSGVTFLLASKLVWSVPIDRGLILLTYGLGSAVAFLGCWVVFGHSQNSSKLKS